MTGQAMWAFVIVAVVAAALIGFLFGRTNGNGAKQKLKELEADLQGKDRELAVYKREVDAHFDQTASLFVSMAGSYKALFEHLSEGYAKLSDGSDRDLFRERVATLLIDVKTTIGACTRTRQRRLRTRTMPRATRSRPRSCRRTPTRMHGLRPTSRPKSTRSVCRQPRPTGQPAMGKSLPPSKKNPGKHLRPVPRRTTTPGRSRASLP